MRFVIGSFVTALVLASPLCAQDPAPDTTPRTSLGKGAWSLAFDAPLYGGGGSGTVGGWKMVGDRTNLGLTLGLQVTGYEATADTLFREDRTAAVELGVHVRRYLRVPAEVTPFVGAGVFGRAFHHAEKLGGYTDRQRGYGGGAQVGAGVEWFPIRRVSLAGDTGVRLNLGRSEGETDYGGSPQDRDTRATDFATYTSRLSFHIYF